MVKVVAHRGCSGEYPESTEIAFRKALALDADMIELDVHLAKDESLIVIHDATVDRTSDGSGKISDMTLPEIKALDAGSWFGEAFKVVSLLRVVRNQESTSAGLFPTSARETLTSPWGWTLLKPATPDRRHPVFRIKGKAYPRYTLVVSQANSIGGYMPCGEIFLRDEDETTRCGRRGLLWRRGSAGGLCDGADCGGSLGGVMRYEWSKDGLLPISKVNTVVSLYMRDRIINHPGKT